MIDRDRKPVLTDKLMQCHLCMTYTYLRCPHCRQHACGRCMALPSDYLVIRRPQPGYLCTNCKEGDD